MREQEINFQEGPEALLDIEHMHSLRTDARDLPHNLAQRWRLEKRPVQLLRLLSPHTLGEVPSVDERYNSLGSTGHFSEHALPTLQVVQGQGAGGSIEMKKGKAMSSSNWRFLAGTCVSQI